MYVLGDVNDNFLNVNSKVKRNILNAKLIQLIDKPTRVAPTSATLLDIAVTNNPEVVTHGDTTPCHAGDHELMSITLDLQKPKRQSTVKTFRQLKNYSPEIFYSRLKGEIHNLNKIFTTDNVDKHLHIFNECFIKCFDSCAPFVTKIIKRSFAPWITDGP